jgi:hypothetical protein
MGLFKKSREPRGAFGLVSESVNLLRAAPPSAIFAFLAGSVPFVAAFLYFWADMSRSAFAEERCTAFSLLLALLFFWMKTWHSVFASELMAALGGTRIPWTARRVIHSFVFQLYTQVSGFIVIPAALLITLPFPAVYAFYQNLTVVSADPGLGTREKIAVAWRAALLWPRENTMVIWMFCPWLLALGIAGGYGISGLLQSPFISSLDIGGRWLMIMIIMIFFQVATPLSPFGFAITWNLAVAIIAIPFLLHSLLGIETIFITAGPMSILNSTFLAIVFFLSYMVLDLHAKTAYVLRMFYAESLGTGMDLLVTLRSFRNKEPVR